SIEQKNQNEAEAKKLLSSVDDYLLSELGINLPEPPENTLKNRMFTVSLKDISSSRFGPIYHQVYYQDLLLAIENSAFDKSKLGIHLSEITYGASFNNHYVSKGIPLLRIKDLKRNKISVNKVVYLPVEARSKLGNCFVNTNDFLITRSGTIGIVAIVPKDINGFAFGSFMIKFRLSEIANLNKEYLSYYLNSILLIKIVERNKIGAIQGNITIPTIKSLPIILPPLDKQKEIAGHISGIREKAQKLKDQTAVALKAAYKEIEDILIGN
ncbi:MAG: hypothetical protein GXO89_06480, partial [Chlorobi bacterium]|nr:hypothetical protein [Chlorobiota bacterium]